MVGIDPNSFRSNPDGSWTVLDDTKILENVDSIYSNSLLLTSDTVIRRGMFQMKSVDLIDLLEMQTKQA